MIEVELTTGVALEAVRVIDAPVGGVTPPLGVPPPVVGGGAVGDSDLQPAKNTSSSARRTNISFRCLKSIISAPKLLFPPSSSASGASTALHAEIHRHSCAAAHCLTGQSLAEHFENQIHCYDRAPRFRVASTVLRKQSGEGCLVQGRRVERQEGAQILSAAIDGDQRRNGPHERRRNKMTAVGSHVRSAVAIDADIVEADIR